METLTKTHKALPISDNQLDSLTNTEYVAAFEEIGDLHNHKLTVSCKTPIISPLRYPGAKRRLAGYIQSFLTRHDLSPDLFIEPFAGGASVALRLLYNKSVKKIALIDRDPLVAAFWRTVFFDSEWLIEQIANIDVSVSQWDYYKHLPDSDIRSMAIKCLFLNRTSFSGIIAPSAGPIGGRKQSSDYSIDCRFPRKTLIKRVEQAASMRERVAFVWNLSFFAALNRIDKMRERGSLPKDIFYYFDPPFFEKADKLYNYYFEDKQHMLLRDAVMKIKEPWIMSYDSAKEVDRLYSQVASGTAFVEMLYGDSQNGGNRTAKEVILSNLPLTPGETRLWKSKSECF